MGDSLLMNNSLSMTKDIELEQGELIANNVVLFFDWKFLLERYFYSIEFF